MNWKKILYLFTLVGLLFTVSACSDADDSGGTDTNGDDGESVTEISALFPSGEEPRSLPSDLSEHPTFQYIQEKTNSDLDIEMFPSEEYLERLQRLVASGDTPDMVKIWVMEDYPGARDEDNRTVMGLSDLIDEHGPNLKEHITDEMWENATHDGEIYFIPKPQRVSNHNRVTYIRKDWLDNVGMDVPETVDEYLEVMKAFRDQDANGNGDPDDEWAFSGRGEFHWTNWIWFGAFDALPTTWTEVDGTLLPAEVKPGMKDALAWLRMMYEEGLIDPEFISQDRQTMEEKVFNDKVGIIGHLATNLGFWQENIKKVGEHAEFVPAPSPVGPTGTSGGIVTAPEEGGWIIPAGTENPEKVIQLLDWFVTDEGHEFYTNGVPGEEEQWNIDWMKRPGYNDEILASVFGEEFVDLAKQTYEITEQEGISNQATAGIPELPHVGKYPDIEGYTPKLWQDYAVKIITGEYEVDRYDDFIEEYYEKGGDVIIEEVNEWYQENKQ